MGMPARLTKVEAIAVIREIALAERQPSPLAFRRLLRAFAALGLDTVDQREACRGLDIIRGDGSPWRADLAPFIPWPVELPPAAPRGQPIRRR